MSEFGNYFKIISTINTFDEKNIESAKDTFEYFKTIGVVKSDCNFNDNVWQTTDEYSNVGLHFKFSLGTYNKYYKQIFNMELEEFVVYVKSFIATMLGKDALHSLTAFLLDIRRLTSTPLESVCGYHDEFNLNAPYLVTDFLSIFTYEDANEDMLDTLIESCEYFQDALYNDNTGHQRTLAEYDSYLRFDKIIKDYWSSPIPEADRLFYYPLYLWWELTAVIPLRPREFLLTQRDCITYNNKGDYMLRIRRNKLKGSIDGKVVSYKIDKDYATEEIKIPESLGNEFKKYQFLTSEYEGNELDTLFVTDPHYARWGHKKDVRSRYLTYVNMNTILKSFFRDVVCGVYGLKVIYGKADGESLEDNEICYIHLGDTRHIAMINIVTGGGSILTAQTLAGHASIYTSGHYFTNVRKLLQCKANTEYYRIKGGTATFNLKPIALAKPKENGITVMGKGFCFSELYAMNDYYHCSQALGPNGEIGYCPKCQYHREDGVSFYSDDNVYLRNLEDDCNEFERAVKLLKSGIAEPEEIGKALLKVQASSISYETYLKEKGAQDNGENQTDIR